MATTTLAEREACAAPARKAPGPATGPWLNLVRYLRDPIGALTALARTYGDVARVRLGPHQLFLVNDPELIKDVLVTHHRSFHKSRAYEEARRLLGHGLLTSEDELHRRQRKLLQPLFVPERVAAYAGRMAEAALRTGDGWTDGAVVDVNAEMSRLTLRIVGQAVFDADVERESTGIGAALADALAVFNRFLLPGSRLIWALPLPSTRRFWSSRARLDELVARLVAERRARGLEGRRDLLSLLLEVRDDEGSGLTDEQIRDEAVTILLAGHETTAVGLAWTWHLLAQHPDVEERLHLELDEALRGRAPTLDDLPRLVFTRMVFSESMRLYPPAWAIARRALVDYDLRGYAVPAGSIVFISQALMHRDPRFFREPERFLPERFAPGTESSRPRYAYFPFGGGPRLCIGERLAWMEGVLVLATLAQRWRLRHVPGQRIRLDPIVTLRPKRGIRMRLERRVG